MFTLTIEDNNGQIADRFSFDHGAYVIGRQETCDIVLPSTSVSRQHARIFVDNGRCYVEDLGSSNGIVVDGQRVLQQRDLGSASQIKVGDFYLYLEYKRPERDSQANVLQTLFINDDSDHYKLVRINDSFAGEEFSLSEVENTIGRTDDNFILLSDSSISRQHGKIVRNGEQYTLLDLGSSNGTRLNGKLVKAPQALSPGDRVHFGNVEFVFVRGNVEVNPEEYAGSPGGGKILLMAGAGILVLIGVAVAGLIFVGYMSFKEQGEQTQSAPGANSIDGKVAAMMRNGRARMKRRDWDGAISDFDEVLAHDPDNAEAMRLKEAARKERKADEQYDRAQSLIEEGRHRTALEVFDAIPEDTVAHDLSREHVAPTREALAYKLKNEAIRKSKTNSKSDLRDAHEKVVESLELNPDDEEATELVEKIEKKMKKKKLKFDAWEAPE